MSIHIHVQHLEGEALHPLWRQYAGELQPQPAYIELDVRDGSLVAGYSGEIGNAVPADVWNGLIRRYPINPDLTEREINALLDEIAPSAQTVLDGARVGWDGSNYSAQCKRDTETPLEEIAASWQTDSGGVWDAEDWFSSVDAASEYGITATTTDQELAEVVQKATDDAWGTTVNGIDRYFEALRDELEN
jgi:hypothetical protein